MQTSEPIQAWRMSRKVTSGGSGCLAAICYLIGIGGLLIALPGAAILPLSIFGTVPFAVVFLAIGYAVDSKTSHVSYCGQCGNQVAETSTLCPYCHSHLHTPPKRIDWVWVTLALTAIAALIFFYIFRPAAYMP
jgi:hypothetical protein